jgi:hypothetical protein
MRWTIREEKARFGGKEVRLGGAVGEEELADD